VERVLTRTSMYERVVLSSTPGAEGLSGIADGSSPNNSRHFPALAAAAQTREHHHQASQASDPITAMAVPSV
jgi:hypothetical protein